MTALLQFPVARGTRVAASTTAASDRDADALAVHCQRRGEDDHIEAGWDLDLVPQLRPALSLTVHVHGNIVGNVIIAPPATGGLAEVCLSVFGSVGGDVTATSAHIYGPVEGSVTAKAVTHKPTARILRDSRDQEEDSGPL